MRACVIAAAIVALSQPALAAKTHKKSSQRHHASLSHHHIVKHHRAQARVRPTMEPGTMVFARTDATDAPTFSDPSFLNRPAPPSAVPAPRFEQFGAPAPSFISEPVRLCTASARNTAL